MASLRNLHDDNELGVGVHDIFSRRQPVCRNQQVFKRDVAVWSLKGEGGAISVVGQVDTSLDRENPPRGYRCKPRGGRQDVRVRSSEPEGLLDESHLAATRQQGTDGRPGKAPLAECARNEGDIGLVTTREETSSTAAFLDLHQQPITQLEAFIRHTIARSGCLRVRDDVYVGPCLEGRLAVSSSAVGQGPDGSGEDCTPGRNDSGGDPLEAWHSEAASGESGGGDGRRETHFFELFPSPALFLWLSTSHRLGFGGAWLGFHTSCGVRRVSVPNLSTYPHPLLLACTGVKV